MQVTVILDDGRKFEGDILVGADGIWSEVSHFDLLVSSLCISYVLKSLNNLLILGTFETFWGTRSNLFKLYMLQWPNRLCASLY